MTKDIIENHLLKIGNSYYKSSDFSKKQWDWNDNSAVFGQTPIRVYVHKRVHFIPLIPFSGRINQSRQVLDCFVSRSF